MSLSELTTNLNYISGLPDKPTLSTSELKAIFDQSGNEIKQYINATLTKEIDALISTINTQITTDENRLTQAQLNKIYPVGSIYMSVDSTSPETYFGGTWTQIKDKFLLSAGDTYSAGSTGGEATHKLTTNEMPKHTHGSKSLTGTLKAYIYHTFGASGIVSQTKDTPNKVGTSSGNDWGGATYTVNATHEHSNVGGDAAHNNMPPYLTVYMWKRTG